MKRMCLYRFEDFPSQKGFGERKRKESQNFQKVKVKFKIQLVCSGRINNIKKSVNACI